MTEIQYYILTMIGLTGVGLSLIWMAVGSLNPAKRITLGILAAVVFLAIATTKLAFWG